MFNRSCIAGCLALVITTCFPPVESLPNVGIADNKSELIVAVDHQAAMGVGVIKLYGTAGFTMSAHSDKPVGPQTYSDEEVAAVVEQGIQSHKRAIKAGVKIAYGTDAGLYPHGQNADGFVDLVEDGMSPAQAIKTAIS